MIYTQYWVCIMNCFVPFWFKFADLKSSEKYKKRLEVLCKVDETNNKISLTQKQAHDLMEMPQYDMSSGYSDLMKSMWLIFFYSSVLPTAILWEIVGICCYYWVEMV